MLEDFFEVISRPEFHGEDVIIMVSKEAAPNHYEYIMQEYREADFQHFLKLRLSEKIDNLGIPYKLKSIRWKWFNRNRLDLWVSFERRPQRYLH